VLRRSCSTRTTLAKRYNLLHKHPLLIEMSIYWFQTTLCILLGGLKAACNSGNGPAAVSSSAAQVAVVGSIARHLKEHQWDGLRFLWKCCVTDHAVCSRIHACAYSLAAPSPCCQS
jgi:hypothetical protein